MLLIKIFLPFVYWRENITSCIPSTYKIFESNRYFLFFIPNAYYNSIVNLYLWEGFRDLFLNISSNESKIWDCNLPFIRKNVTHNACYFTYNRIIIEFSINSYHSQKTCYSMEFADRLFVSHFYSNDWF